LQSLAASLPLPQALHLVYDWHCLYGFAPEALQSVPHPLPGPQPGLLLRAEFHPQRRLRHLGAGRKHPPPGFQSAHNGCFLHPYNVTWQQFGRQFPFALPLASRDYNFLLQPFPFAPLHFTVATAEFFPQDWRLNPAGLRHLLRAMLFASLALDDGFAILYNGKDAGNSIDWMHFHALRCGQLPVQIAFRLASPWPLPYRRAAGTEEEMVEAILDAATQWQHSAGPAATECIAIVRDHGRPACYYFPRHRARECAAPHRFAGRVGAYECCGVFIFEQDSEGLALRNGEIGFANVWQILADVSPIPKE
ncbi:MAG: hypothetical protein JNK48_17275, partial [Bryobacterales bacterium]|nr:hypothetical protein [Bryobacterales bacterium]